jgi:[protein-PII] uridylyltransferase
VPGRAWCRAWTVEVDAAIIELAQTIEIQGRWAVTAVGGYGRHELCPGSDVDLLILHEKLSQTELELLVRALVYPLWDAGLKVGYSVRSTKQAVAASKDELDDATALLDARPLAGASALLHDSRAAAITALRKHPSRFLGDLTEADSARHHRAGDAAEELEPDLKNGAGGMRDVQSLRWAAAALVGSTGLDPLVSARYLGAADRTRLARAYDRLLAERVALHLEVGRPTDVLRLDLQDGVADRLGFEDGDDDRDTKAHRLLTSHYRAARTVAHLHLRAWVLLVNDASRGRRFLRPTERIVDGFEVADGVLRVPPEQIEHELSLPTRLLAALLAEGALLDRTTASSLRNLVRARGGEAWGWDAAAKDRFIAVLWAGSKALPALAELDDVGLIHAMIPEWAPLRGRAQRNPFHRYSLDRHAWHAAATLADLVRDEAWATKAIAHVRDRDALMLGVLLHDVGKAYGEPHSETGIPVARSVSDRMGCSAQTGETIGYLVHQHLLLPDVATKRDVNDPDLAAQIAAEVDTAERLAMLHLLAAADGLATGPSAWSSWKATLVQTAVTRVAAVIDHRDPEETAEGANVTTRDAVTLSGELGSDPQQVQSHLGLLPTRYAASVTPRAVVRHALVASKPLELGDVRTRVTPVDDDGGEGYDELDVVALDRPGLFAKVAGVVALHGGSILEASAFTRDDGVAVDTFTVQRPEETSSSWWLAVEADIYEAVAGRLALRARVARKAATEHRRLSRLPDVVNSVTVHEDASGEATVIEVHTLDRIGVLFEITSALAELELDIVVAKIQTLGHEVVDAFYVRDAAGEVLDDDHAGEVKLGVIAALETFATRAAEQA